MTSTTSDRVTTFLRDTVDLLERQQSAHLGGDADQPLCLTVSRRTGISYRSLGAKVDGEYKTYWFPAQELEMQPVRMDLPMWPILDCLAQLTGESRYAQRVTAMAEALAAHGFDERCGLGYFGEETDFDVVRLGPISSKPETPPHFKPGNTGDCPGLPLDRLWRHAPEQMARMCRAMFLGLVTDSERMDYNRFCGYDFEDREGRHALPPDSRHCAFDTAGARMIHWWGSSVAHTGDERCLGWAQRMADKWQAVQHPDSGLMPNFFGAVAEYAPVQPPGQWAEVRGGSMTAMTLIEAAEQLRRRPEGHALAEQVTAMAVKLARGLARHSYDPQRRLFREVMHLDGRPYEQTARYAFRTQAEKDAAVRRNPHYEQVAVFQGVGLYRDPPFWSECAGSDVPYHLAYVAQRTGDAELRDQVAAMREPILEEAHRFEGPMTPDGRWSFYGSARYIQAFLLMERMTGDACYRAAAVDLADRETNLLDADADPAWWRTRDRTVLLDALLMLAEAQAEDK